MNYKSLCEESLVKLLKANDEAAFKEIYIRYWKDLYSIALSKLHLKQIAEELVQDIFVNLWEKRSNNIILHLESYLHAAIRYQVINYFKSSIIKEKYLHRLKACFSQNDSNGETQLLLRELKHIIDNTVHQLPEKTQIIFNLSRKDNCTIKEISQTMHLSEKAVEYHITRSLKTLRLHLKEFVFLY